MARGSNATAGVDFFRSMADIPGCLTSLLPKDCLALLGSSREDRIRSSVLLGSTCYNLRLVTSDGCIHCMPDRVSVDQHMTERSESSRVDARELVYSMLGLPIASMCIYRQHWKNMVPAEPGLESLCTFNCVYADRGEVKDYLARRGASLVLEMERRSATAIQVQQRWTYASREKIESAAWEGELNEPILLVSVGLSGARYRTKSGIEYLDYVDPNAPSPAGKYPWQFRLFAAIKKMRCRATTAAQKNAISTLFHLVNGPLVTFGANIAVFVEALRHLTPAPNEGMISADELFCDAQMMRCIQLKDWIYVPVADDSPSEFFTDIRRVIIK